MCRHVTSPVLGKAGERKLRNKTGAPQRDRRGRLSFLWSAEKPGEGGVWTVVTQGFTLRSATSPVRAAGERTVSSRISARPKAGSKKGRLTMTTHLVAVLSARPAGPTHEPDKRPSGATSEPCEDLPGGAGEVRRRARPRERDIERRRAWLFDVKRCAAVLCSSAAYLVSAGAVMVLAYFAARLVALWIIGPVN